VLLSGSLKAYEVKGRLQITNDWQPRVYMASINSPDNLFVASPEFIINETFIDAEGNFLMSGQDLPDDPQFYRLYLVRNNLLSMEFVSDSVRNFMHLILDNDSKITLENEAGINIFDSIRIEGSERNVTLSRFEKIYYQKRKLINRINTSAKRNFQNQSLNKYIHGFVNTCSDPLTGLFAIYHIEDKETDFLMNSDFFFDFQKRMRETCPNQLYTGAYDELLDNLVGYRNLVCEIPAITKPWRNWVILGESILILILLFLLFKRKKNSENEIDIRTLLTDKERLIWEKLSAGRSNKEIAADLFIELSTVKTHINNLYKRLGVSNRKEATAKYHHQKWTE